jgi:hypothetical protein
MKINILAITILALVFSALAEKPIFGGYKRIEDENEDYNLEKVINAARSKILNNSVQAAMYRDSLKYVTAYKKQDDDDCYKIIHALSTGYEYDMGLLENIVFVEGKKVQAEHSIAHTPTGVYRSGNIIKQLKKEVKWVVNTHGGSLTVTKVHEYVDFPGETYYVVTSEITFKDSNGEVVVANTSVFSKKGNEYLLSKDVMNHFG